MCRACVSRDCAEPCLVSVAWFRNIESSQLCPLWTQAAKATSDLWCFLFSSKICKDSSVRLDLTEKEKEGSVEGEGTGGRWPSLSLPSPQSWASLNQTRPSSWWGLLPGGQARCGAPNGRGEVEGRVGGEGPQATVHCPHRAVLWLSPGHRAGPERIPAGPTPEAVWCVCSFPKGPVMYWKLHGSQLAAPAAPTPAP